MVPSRAGFLNIQTVKGKSGNTEVKLSPRQSDLDKMRADVSSKHYLETSDLLYLRKEIDSIAAWIVEQARIANADNVIPMAKKKKS